ncbi:MAG TPA: vanadium-dependent haloperoxidase [Vicinamibacterales bacterium]
MERRAPGIADARLKRLGDSARLFALANLATADALISCWRPITAIREGDTDRNPDTAPDPAWQPLVNTPPYPDYPSGANVVSGAMTRVLQLFFGTDRLEFDVTTTATEPVQKTRTFTKLSDAAQEVVDARMYRGIHFRFADEAARRQGQQVANWVVGGFLRKERGRK